MTTQLPLAFEIGTFVVLITVLIADLLLVVKRPHEPSMKEAGLWVSFYVTLALIFAGLMYWLADAQHASEFLTGWITEYSLSVDNLFVFIIILTKFAVPRKYQQQVLMVGILMALILRGIFILIGAAMIENFSWIFYIFGVFLLYTAWKQAQHSGESDDDVGEMGIIRQLRKVMPITNEYHENKIRVTIDGKRVWTPMIIVFISLGLTDLLFAVDSIPAIFGITQSPFIVFTANIFALMGLRQLYFLLGGLMNRLVYLSVALSFILAFIGVKLIFHALHINELPFINGGEPVSWVPDIPTQVSLGVILGTIVVATIASLLSSKGKALQGVADVKMAISDYEHLDADADQATRDAAVEKIEQKHAAALKAIANTKAEVTDLDEGQPLQKDYERLLAAHRDPNQSDGLGEQRQTSRADGAADQLNDLTADLGRGNKKKD